MQQLIFHLSFPTMPAVYTPLWAKALIWGGAIAAAVLIYLYVRRQERYWSKGIFPPNLKFTRENLMQAYISAAAMLLLKNRYQMTGKLAFINGYFHRQFPECYEDFQKRYIEALQRPVSVKSLADWLNQHLKTDSEKEQLVQFLFDLSWYDGELNDSEYAALQLMTRLLGLQWEPFEQKIRERDRNQSKVLHQEIGSNDLYFKALELKSGSSEADVKTAYRQLVKIYHPDKYMQEAPAVRERAAAKFREIQEAYKYLTERTL